MNKITAMAKFLLPFAFTLLLSSIHVQAQERVDISPPTWPKGEFEKYNGLMATMPTNPPQAVGKSHAITGTYSAPAIRAGFESLERGGTAADAAMTTAVTQIALCGGSWVSYTGLLSVVYYDAESGKVYNLNAGYNTVIGEDDPKSIPAANALASDVYGGTPSGRSALVPGFMAGVDAVHEKFGKLPFASIFDSAIYYADNGFEVSPYFEKFMQPRKDVLTRLPAIKKIFADDQGNLLKAGDTLYQKELAKTLKNVAEQRSAYMYTGPWAEKFVKAVQDEGGKITMEDMKKYKVIWSEPARGKYRDVEIVSHGAPSIGGLNTIETLRLYEASGLKSKGHYSKSPEALFWLAQFFRVGLISYLPESLQKQLEDSVGCDLSAESRMKAETTRKIWQALKDGKFALTAKPKTPNNHSDAIVAVDRWGNVCCVVHSINTVMWGKTGIFVDGISVNDSASFQQAQIAKAGPGVRLPGPTNPVIVLNKDGKPILGGSAMGSGLNQKTIQCMISVLDFGMDPQSAIKAPYLMFPRYDGFAGTTQRVIKNEIDPQVIKQVMAMGLKIEELDKNGRYAQGLWVGISIDPKTGQLKAAAPHVTNGVAIAK